jgi:peptide/nickel transport system substrate-binding protein
MIDAIKVETDTAKRDKMIQDALAMTRDEAHYVPIHHQMRPWAMKKNIQTVHRSDDRPEARFTRID